MCFKCWSKDSPTAHGTDHDEASVPVKTMEIHRGSDIHLQPMEDLLLEKVNTWKDVTPREDCAAAGSWPDLWPHWRRTSHWRRFSGRTVDPTGDPLLEQPNPKGLHAVESTHAGAVHEELNPWEELTLEKFVDNCLCWERPENGAVEDWEESSLEQEAAAETAWGELTIVPSLYPPVLLHGVTIKPL